MKKIALLVGLALASIGAQAGDYYIGAASQSITYKDLSGQLSSTLAGSVGGTSTAQFETKTSGVRVFGGYWYNPTTAFELGFSSIDDSGYTGSGTAKNSVSYTYAGKIGVKALDASLLFYPLDMNEWSKGLFLQIGITRATVTEDATVKGTSTVSASASNTASSINYGIGYDYTIANGFFARASYGYARELGDYKDFDASTLSLGLGYRF